MELTSRVIPYAASIGTSSRACRRPRELIGRAESLRDQSLRSIAFACRTRISGVVGGWSRYCWTRKWSWAYVSRASAARTGSQETMSTSASGPRGTSRTGMPPHQSTFFGPALPAS